MEFIIIYNSIMVKFSSVNYPPFKERHLDYSRCLSLLVIIESEVALWPNYQKDIKGFVMNI